MVRAAETVHFGTKYHVYQKNSRGTLATTRPFSAFVVGDFAGELDYTEGGAILSSQSTFLMRLLPGRLREPRCNWRPRPAMCWMDSVRGAP